MSRNPTTVSLPVSMFATGNGAPGAPLADDRVYVSLARDMPLLLAAKTDPFEWIMHPGDMTDYSNDGIWCYGGRQCGNDAAAPVGKGPDDIRKRLVAIQANDYVFGSGGGGTPRDPVMVEIETIVTGKALRIMKWNKTKSTKAFRDNGVRDVVLTYVRVQLRKKGLDLDDTALVSAAYDAEWATLTAKARDLVAQRNDDDDDFDVDAIVAAAAAKKAA